MSCYSPQPRCSPAATRLLGCNDPAVVIQSRVAKIGRLRAGSAFHPASSYAKIAWWHVRTFSGLEGDIRCVSVICRLTFTPFDLRTSPMKVCEGAAPGTYCQEGTSTSDGAVPCPLGHYCLGTYHDLKPCTVPEGVVTSQAYLHGTRKVALWLLLQEKLTII